MVRSVIVFFLALSPWALSLYGHYYAQQENLWSVDSPYRALASIAILALGLILSFLLYIRLTRVRT